MGSTLEIRDLHVNVDDKEILKGVDLTIKPGEVHALMGPNGSGKSTLANSLMGHPGYQVTQGVAVFKGENILELAPDERAKMGLFLAFQYPVAIPGVSLANFLRSAINARRKVDDPKDKGIPIGEFRALLKKKMDLLEMGHEFAGRYLNDGFSGGEKKRAEILQLATLEPEVAILDETDSGLDIDALRIVASGVNRLRSPERAIVLVTHYQRLLDYIVPDFVHVLVDGQVALSGAKELALELESRGYTWLEREPARQAAS
jgi:Fe-S cluster assembly ATP-binding protein